MFETLRAGNILLADRAYDSNALRERLAEVGAWGTSPVIVGSPRSVSVRQVMFPSTEPSTEMSPTPSKSPVTLVSAWIKECCTLRGGSDLTHPTRKPLAGRGA